MNRLPLMLLTIALLMTGVSFADVQSYNYPTDNEQPVPRWITQQELATPGPYVIDTVTPPPDNPVYLDGEFEPKQGIMVRWPFYYEDIFAGIVDEAQDVATVFIIVANASMQSQCTSVLANYGVGLDNVEWFYVSSNAIWARDFGPWFVDDQGSWSIVDMKYYPTRPQDDYIPEWLAGEWNLGYYGPDLYHEGGNMMNDGHGTMMMSTRVLLANPGMTEAEVQQIYQDYWGQDNVHIFQRISNDGTGHIDIWSKILNEHTILVAEFQPNDVNYNLVEGHAATMDNIPTFDGGTFDIVRIPMPAYTGGGYYKSYTNSILINNKAIIPIYGLASDADAIQAYQDGLGPDWQVVGINCTQIAPLGGSIHCVTIEIPNNTQPPVSIELLPVGEPIYIGWGGGTFQFSAILSNLTDAPFSGQAITEAILPNGNVFGPILQYNINMTAFQVINSPTLSQNVPGGAPGGEYSYVGKITQNGNVVAQDSFIFHKSGIGPGPDDVWPVNGSFIAGDDDGMRGGLPREFSMSEAWPNPFNPTTSLNLNLPERSDASVNVYNISGRHVATLYQGPITAGQHTLTFDGSNLSSGVYFIHATVANQGTMMRKVTLMK